MYIKWAAAIILIVLGISGIITGLTVIAHANGDDDDDWEDEEEVEE